MIETPPAVKDLVLIGGGHANVQVLRKFAMEPEAGIRLTLISGDVITPYSGMLPGCIGGVYSDADIHIDLLNLCRFAGARLILSPATGLDLTANKVLFQQRPPLHFDALSINCGATPEQTADFAVKPIAEFLPKYRNLVAQCQSGDRVLVIGGGAGGVEVSLALREVLPTDVSLSLVSKTLLPDFGDRARKLVLNTLQQAGVEWLSDRVVSDQAPVVVFEQAGQQSFQHVVWVTGVQAPEWLKSSELATDGQGFATVNQYLQSVSHENVFVAGDAADLQGQARPKSGVYAVRAGPHLAENLRRFLTQQPLKPWRAQKKHLALIGLGQGSALAARGAFALKGAFWWWLKTKIDLRFMNKFNDLPSMDEVSYEMSSALRADLPDEGMRCGGCGAKLAAEPLRRVLARIEVPRAEHVRLGIGDDAAELVVASGSQLLTVDGFRKMIDDPYLFGRIAAHHSVNDILAMGAQPTSALALVTLPLMADTLIEEDLFQLLSGVLDVLKEYGAPLVGGHSAEGVEMSIGLTVTGEVRGEANTKAGARSGDMLVLTKPLGTGVVLAAAMSGAGSRDYFSEVLAGMDKSNAPAVGVLAAHQVSAMTDVTGFGLAGHLSEMLRASDIGVRLQLANVPLYEGYKLLADEQSSLQMANELALQDYQLLDGIRPDDLRLRVLADPQTSGGMLASIPHVQLAGCLSQLNALGYQAACIGEFTDQGWVVGE